MYYELRLVKEACKRASMPKKNQGKAPSAKTDLACIASGQDGAG